MTIIETFIRLRNDLKLWVANNLRVKLDKNLGTEENGKILSVDENGDIVTSTLTASDVGALPMDTTFASLPGAPDITQDPEDKVLYVVDDSGNIVAQIDARGVHTTDVLLGLTEVSMQEHLSEFKNHTHDEIPAVIDNLVSTSTTDALSAAQGAALKIAIDSITTDIGDMGGGDMMKATYDTNNSGVVDNAERLAGHAASYFATADSAVGKKAAGGGEIFNDYDNNQATAPYSHAQGQSARATGVASSASGFNIEAAQTHQFVVGRYNDNKNTTLFEVGNGRNDDSRSNAFEAYADGHAEVQTMGTTNNSVATKEYVDNANINVLLKKIDASYGIAGKGANVPDTGVFIRTLVSISIDGNICIFGEDEEDQIAFSFSPERSVNEIPGLIEGKLYRITIIDENSNILELCNIEGVDQSYNPESVLPLSGKAVAEAMANYVDSRLYIGSEPPANPIEGMIWITPLTQ